MPKLILVLILCVSSYISNAQKKYTCKFADTLTINLPDSALRQMSKMSSQQDIALTPEMELEIFAQLKASRLSMYQLRIVRAEKDQTIIRIDPSSKAGNMTVKTFDSVLYKDDELFMESDTPTGFSSEPFGALKKEFVATGKRISILNYQCDEYLSTDSTCYTWVTAELPDYINPGIRKGNIKGAILGFQLKGQAYTTKCVLSRLE